jgi:hypothetical protein
MTVRFKRALLTVVSGSALAMAPLAFATVVVPAASQADDCDHAQAAEQDVPCGPAQQPPPAKSQAAPGGGVNCPDGTIVDDENKQCVDLLSGISKQLQALPPPPSLAGFGGLGGGGGGGAGGVSGLGLPGGIPSLGTVNLPDIVLPSLGLGLVPNVQFNLNPQVALPGFP